MRCQKSSELIDDHRSSRSLAVTIIGMASHVSGGIIASLRSATAGTLSINRIVPSVRWSADIIVADSKSPQTLGGTCAPKGRRPMCTGINSQEGPAHGTGWALRSIKPINPLSIRLFVFQNVSMIFNVCLQFLIKGIYKKCTLFLMFCVLLYKLFVLPHPPHFRPPPV